MVPFSEPAKVGLPMWITVPMGAVTGVLIGIVVAIPALRLRGPYLAIVTLAVPVILQGVVFLFPDVTGGELGLFGLPNLSESPQFQYYFCLVIMLICVAVMYKLTDRRSRYVRTGMIIHAIREDEISARTTGINTVRYKVLAFALSGFFAGIAGGLYAHTMTVVGPTTLEFIFSIYPLIWTIFGGSGTIYGPVIGAYLLYFLSSELLVIVPEIRMAIFTAIIIAMILFMPEGVTRWIRDKLETRCPRCKVLNHWRRQACRVCETPLHRVAAEAMGTRREVTL
jgi:branched-chain amino acid transport system permease protein